MRRFVGLVALIILPPLMALIVLAAKTRGLTIPAVMDTAQLARHLAAGEGFVTSAVRPLSLMFHADLANHPDLYHAPVQPLVLSLAFHFIHASDRVTTATMCSLWILSVWLTYAVARTWCNARVANLAALLYGSSVGALGAAAQGLPYPLLAVTTLLALWAAIPDPRHSDEEPEGDLSQDTPLWRVAVAGLVVAMAVLTHYAMLAFAVVLAGFLLMTQRRGGRAVGMFVVGFLVPVVPWLWRNVLVTGGPFFTLYGYEALAGTASYPGESVWRTLSLPPAPVVFIVSHPLEMLRKLATGLAVFRGETLTLVDPVVVFLFLAGLLSVSIHRRWRWLVAIIAASAGLVIVGTSLLRPEPLLLLAWLPMLALVGAVQVSNWVQRQLGHGLTLGRVTIPARLARVSAYSAVTVLLMFPMFGYFVLSRPEPLSPMSDALRGATRQLPAEARLMTDQPALVAWYGERRAIELCQREPDLDRLERVLGPLDGILVTTAVVPLPAAERGDWWSWVLAPRGIYRGLVPAERMPANAALRVRPKPAEKGGS